MSEPFTGAELFSRRAHRKKIGKKILCHTVWQALLILLSLMYLYTLIWMLSTALKTSSEFYAHPMSLWVRNPQWYNFVKVTKLVPFFRYVGNTLILVASCVLGTVLSSSLVAFSFAKLRWPGREACFMILLATMMLPAQVLQIPTFVLFSKMGWLDTYLPIIVPTFFGGGAFNIFLTREYYRGITDELLLAAKIDGCGYFRIWWRIMVPLCLPVTLTVTVMTFMNTWNDYMNPLIYLQSPDLSPLSLGLRAFRQQYNDQWDMMMTGAVLSVIPTLVLYFVFQKYFMQGISISSGVKG